MERCADVTACYRLREVRYKQLSGNVLLYREDDSARCGLLVKIKIFLVVCVSNTDIFHLVHLSALAVVVHQGEIQKIQTEDHIDQYFHGYASRRVI